MSIVGQMLDGAPLHLRPVYRLARDKIFSLLVVSASFGVELSLFELGRPQIIVIRDDVSVTSASPFLATENLQRELGQCELVTIFRGEPEALQVLDVATYVSIFATSAAIIETVPERAEAWADYISNVNAGDMHVQVYEASPSVLHYG